MSTPETMIIPNRFNGPPESGNGGYSAGLLAARLSAAGAVEVTLRVPPPLQVALAVTASDDGIVASDGDTVVATARAAEFTDPPAPAVPYEVAVEASRRYPGFTGHPFPTCYTCGPERPDGLRVFPGRLAGGRTAAPFVVPEDVTTATMWAALDCPGGWAVTQETRPHVLGRITARVDAVPPPGTRCVVTALLLEEQGRKAHVVSTVRPADGGTPYAVARATWIALR